GRIQDLTAAGVFASSAGDTSSVTTLKPTRSLCPKDVVMAVGRIASSRNQDASDARRIVSGVERVPAAAEIGLEPGAEIHRIGFLRNADVAEISGAIARGHIHAAAEGDGKMREVATDPPFLLEGIVGGLGG